MKKILFLGTLMISLVFLGLTTSGQGNLLTEGALTPQLIVENSDSAVNLKKLQGKYVLVNFWSSADASSRLKSNEYASLSLPEDVEIERISVNFDRSERLFEEIVSRDRLDKQTQYYVDGKAAEAIIHNFGLRDGYKSFLIGPNGKIVAVNPDNDYLVSVLSPDC